MPSKAAPNPCCCLRLLRTQVREAVTLMAREGLVLIDDQPGGFPEGGTSGCCPAWDGPACMHNLRPSAAMWEPGAWKSAMHSSAAPVSSALFIPAYLACRCRRISSSSRQRGSDAARSGQPATPAEVLLGASGGCAAGDRGVQARVWHGWRAAAAHSRHGVCGPDGQRGRAAAWADARGVHGSGSGGRHAWAQRGRQRCGSGAAIACYTLVLLLLLTQRCCLHLCLSLLRVQDV